MPDADCTLITLRVGFALNDINGLDDCALAGVRRNQHLVYRPMPTLPNLPPSLPHGVTPEQAGRAWAWKWLMGRRNHAAALNRDPSVVRGYRSSILRRTANLFAPWEIAEYPGCRRVLAMLCGVKVGTLDGWLYSDRAVSKRARARLASVCRDRAAQLIALAEECEAPVPEPDKPARIARKGRGG